MKKYLLLCATTPGPFLVRFLGLGKFRTNQKRTNEVNNIRRNIYNKFAHKWTIYSIK